MSSVLRNCPGCFRMFETPVMTVMQTVLNSPEEPWKCDRCRYGLPPCPPEFAADPTEIPRENFCRAPVGTDGKCGAYGCIIR